eukprot:CAMPEP_0174832782 /NCGR_PEP_ID=MMETSP1114-20130205/3852_1 /TAXON_ID=312471 /ORGANISM="Neobodo designis, Strain CCAP 1951/1" /LENGTH=401 /DNA_ID=CAMNT_0016066649 /DNA_START=133 /DNA_END=1338 /DNA_ORIENTATION=+
MASPRSTLASRVAHDDVNMDEKTLTAVFNALRDRVYQRSFNLRKTFRELDAEGHGIVPIEDFAKEMERFFTLSPLEGKCLRVLLEESDFRRDGKIDFREFCEMLKMRDYDSEPTVSEMQRKRLHGAVDPRMRGMLREGQTAIAVQGGVPTNELGHMRIECPFGVLGDSERMDAVISAFFTHKTGQLRDVFNKHDADHDGYLTRGEFRTAMKEVDRYVFDNEIDSLLDSLLDNGGGAAMRKRHLSSGANNKANLINIEHFVTGAGREYLKKKAHRSNAHANPFVWAQPAPPKTAQHSPRGRRPAPPSNKDASLLPESIAGASPRSGSKRAPGSSRSSSRRGETRSSELRSQEMRLRLLELRRDDPYFALAMDERKGRQGAALAVGPSTPRLPAIGSARGAPK